MGAPLPRLPGDGARAERGHRAGPRDARVRRGGRGPSRDAAPRGGALVGRGRAPPPPLADLVHGAHPRPGGGAAGGGSDDVADREAGATSPSWGGTSARAQALRLAPPHPPPRAPPASRAPPSRSARGRYPSRRGYRPRAAGFLVAAAIAVFLRAF